jgi:hypothetical protein
MASSMGLATCFVAARMAYLSQGGQRQNAAYGWVRAND